MQENIYASYLTHHGIKGQRWGVRRFQNKDGSLTPEGKKRYDNDASSNKSGYKNANELIKAKMNTKVSDLAGGAGEELAIYAATYAVAIAAISLYGKISEKISRKQRGEAFEDFYENREFKKLSDVPKLTKKMSPSESIKVTNPDYPDIGSTMNCTFCTIALALREKGYNVKAAKTDSGFYTDELFDKTFKSPEVKMKKVRKVDNVIDELNSKGDGAYGNITVNWMYGGAHSIFWKNENGTTNFYDGQDGKAYSSYSDKKSLFNAINLSNIKYSRLDNCEPTTYALTAVESIKK